ncbi:hypothetical protein C8R43DRAFT_1116586 [Mycena crocata]|nr:hypothetical protein C8R43DRAFT_1116586 [Mycena crocata]
MFLTQLKPTTRLQLIAINDIRKVAALVLQNPEVPWDQLSPKELEDGWREVFEEEMRPKMLGGAALAWAVRVGRKEIGSMFNFFNEVGFNTDIPALHAESTRSTPV